MHSKLKITFTHSRDCCTCRAMEKRYEVTFTGRLTIQADTKEEALEGFWETITEMFAREDISDAKVSKEEL